MPFFNIVAATNENTVVTEYEPVKARSDSYQSEAELEKEFIRMLTEQGYTYLNIHSEEDLIRNLRECMEELNDYKFSDDEWSRFFSDALANPNEDIADKTRKSQEDNVQVLKRDDGSSENITIIDRKNIHNNKLQVINQYVIGIEDGAKHTILNILTKYCIFTAEDMLLVMRPYQITATERILNRIEIANNYKKYGDIAGGGYIWHTTGSGKTLTSFKSARLASQLSYIDKVLFVVDRKDLDYQTMKEYDRFEKGVANSNSNTVLINFFGNTLFENY